MERGDGRRGDERGAAAVRYAMVAGLATLVMAAGVAGSGIMSGLEATWTATASERLRDGGTAPAGGIATGPLRPADACDDEEPVAAFWRQTLGRC